MLEQLRAWLNGSREYYSGVVLYSALGDDDQLLELFKKGRTDYTARRLPIVLREVFDGMHSKVEFSPAPSHTVREGEAVAEAVVRKVKAVASNEPVNPQVYAICKEAADKKYKEVMNQRAELFALAKAEDLTDQNTDDRIAARTKLALSVVDGFQQASRLYERADYVRTHGRLPDIVITQEETDYNSLPDHLVKQALDNLRKNYNKMKKREATAERTLLLQKHESNIKKLEARWLLLKPVH